MHNNESLKIVEIFKYLDLKVPSNLRQNVINGQKQERDHIICLRIHAITEKLSVGSSRNAIFDTLVTLLLLHEVEVSGDSIPISTLKEFERILLRNLSKTRNKHNIQPLFLETISLLIEIVALERVVQIAIHAQGNFNLS